MQNVWITKDIFFHFGKAFYQLEDHGCRQSEIPPRWADPLVFSTTVSVPLFTDTTGPREQLTFSFLKKPLKTGSVNTTVGFKADGVFLWHGSPLVRSHLESTITEGCKQAGQSPKG